MIQWILVASFDGAVRSYGPYSDEEMGKKKAELFDKYKADSVDAHRYVGRQMRSLGYD